VKGNLAARTWEIPKLVADINLAHPKLGKPVRLPIEASAKADLENQSVSLNAAANAEDLDFRLQFAAKQLTPLDATFDLSSKRLNLDRYPFLLGGLAPPDAKAKPRTDDALDLSALNGRTVNGKIRVGSMQAKNVKVADLAADVKLARGTLAVEPLSASLYEGKLNGSFIASARGNEITVKQNLQGIQINPLLKDAADKDILEGKGDVSLDVSGAGATVTALKRSLNGNARMVLKDGAYKGINLAEVFRKAQSALGRAPQNAAASGGPQKTDFTELSASFVIKGGVAHNDDLSLKSPFIRAGGSGSLDIAASTLDYTLRPTVVATATGQEGREASGLTVPVHAHGPLDALKYDVDYRGLLTDSVKDRLNQQLNQRLGQALGGKGEAPKADAQKGGAAPSQDPKDVLRDQVRDRLKGILGR
jgi:AsmA protein